MITLDTRNPDFENPMTFGDYYPDPDETLTCPGCGKTWERWGDEWEAAGERTSDKRPVIGKVCRACALDEALGDEKTLLDFAKAYRLDSRAMKYAMVRRDQDAINDWIWNDAAKLMRESDPFLLSVCVAEYVTGTDYRKDELTDFVMGGWQ